MISRGNHQAHTGKHRESQFESDVERVKHRVIMRENRRGVGPQIPLFVSSLRGRSPPDRLKSRSTNRSVLAVLLLAAVPASAKPDSPLSVADAIRALKPGEFIWANELVSEGPILLVINLRTQRTLLYRNGIPVAASTISSGSPGRSTPVGRYTILEKRRVHYSSRYNNAPMPFMQRLSWKGIALHGGHLPGYPASHGCIRLPRAFAEKLFGVTSVGTSVLVTSKNELPRVMADSALDRANGPVAATGLANLGQRRVMTVVVSERDRQLLVLADGRVIARTIAALATPLSEMLAYRSLPGEGGWDEWAFSTRPAFTRSSAPWPRLAVSDQDRAALSAALAPGSTVLLVPDSLAGP